MSELPERLTPADPRDRANPLAFALRFQGRERVHNADESMSAIVAGHPRRGEWFEVWPQADFDAAPKGRGD